MAKYSKEELKEMAIETCEAINKGDMRGMILLSQMSFITGLPQQVVFDKIKQLAL